LDLVEKLLPVRQLWRRLISFGIWEGLPRSDVKHVVATNVFIVVGVGLMLVYPWVNMAVGHPAATLFAYVELTVAPIFALGLYLNHRRIYWAAPTLFVLVGISTVTIGVILVGRGIGSDLFYTVLAIVPFLVYSRRHSVFAVFMAFLGLGAALVSAAFLSRYPVFGDHLPADTEHHSYIWSLGGLHLMLIIIGYNARRTTADVEDELDRETQKSEKLLLNILPKSVSERLKEEDRVIADHFDNVSVLFADIVDFTTMSEKLTPRELVDFLNGIFSHFDEMVKELKLEKIKTIGDAYMVAAGIPEPRVDHAEALMHLAVKMIQTCRTIRTPTGVPFRLRIGISTGPVVAGVIGVNKFIYDLWGDTVNTANRMESHGQAGCIQVTENTYEQVKDKFSFADQREISVKGKGLMRTWILHAPETA